MEAIMAKRRTYFRLELKAGWVELGNVRLSAMQHKGESRLQAAMRFAIEKRKQSFKETGSRYCLLQECEMPTTSGTTGKLVREWKMTNVKEELVQKAKRGSWGEIYLSAVAEVL
jgi:hypothetical protein